MSIKPVEHLCGIYAIRNKVNNKSYIGESTDIHTRWMNHIWAMDRHAHINKHLENAWHKYGKDNFEFIVLAECEPNMLHDLETKYIALFNTANPNAGYNLTVGGDGAVEINEELRIKKSEALKKHYAENPEKAKQRFAAVAAAIRTPEARQYKKEQTLKQFQNPEFYKKYLETRRSDEFREKLRKANLGRKMDDETKQKIAKTLGKSVMCVETGEVFPSAIEASRCLPGNVNVNAVLSGKRKMAGGYHWIHVDIT